MMAVRILVVLAMVLGLGSVAHGQAVEFECPGPEDLDEGSCPRGFNKGYDNEADEWLCLYDGTKSYYDEDVDERGRTKKYKTAEGRCVKGYANGSAWSVMIDEGGHAKTSGSFKEGTPVGAHVTTLLGQVTSVACFSDDVEDSDSEPMWSFGVSGAPEKPEPLRRGDFDSGEEYKDAKAEYKEEMSAYNEEFADFKVQAARLSALQSACPTPNDKLCAYAAEEGDEEFGEGICVDGGYALIIKKIGPLKVTRTTHGTMEIRCNSSAKCDPEEDDECERWSATQEPPPEAPIKPTLREFKKETDDISEAKEMLKEAMEAYRDALPSYKGLLAIYKKGASTLDKYKNACAAPTDAFCAFLDDHHNSDEEEDEEDEDGPEVEWSEVDEKTCAYGMAVKHAFAVQGGNRGAAYARSTRLGTHLGKCLVPHDDEDTGETDIEELWSISLEFPHENMDEALMEGPPKRSDYDDNESFKDDQQMFNEAQADYKRLEAAFRAEAGRLQRAVDSCPTVTDDTCSFGGGEDNEGTLSINDEEACIMGRATMIQGRFKEQDDEEILDGYHKTYTSLGIVSASCHKMSKERGEDDYGNAEYYYESEAIWEVENEPPHLDEGPPSKTDFPDDPDAYGEAKDEYAEYKREVALFKSISADIEKLGKKCPRLDNGYCRATGECQETGACKYDKEEEECSPASTGHCKQSRSCKDDGMCKYDRESGECFDPEP